MNQMCPDPTAPEPERDSAQSSAAEPLAGPERPSPAALVSPLEPTWREPYARITCAADIQPRAIEWLWQWRVPRGKLTLFAGDPKLGKSLVTATLAAAVSRGLLLPGNDVPCPVGKVLILNAEDDPADTVIWRLNAAGADLSMIHFVESVIQSDGTESFPSLRIDIAAIAAAVARLRDCALIIFDPVTAFLGVDDSNNAVVRAVLGPLALLAQRSGAAVILVSHLTKGGSANGKLRVLGSIGYVGACRAGSIFAADPTDRSRRRRLMLDNGGNAAELVPPLVYTIETSDDGSPCVSWSDIQVDVTVEEALRPGRILRARSGFGSGSGSGPNAPDSVACEQWLRQALAGGRVSAGDIRRAGESAGYAWPTLNRIRPRIGAVARREGFGPGSKSYWQLPERPHHG
jgi:hypothetical protein